jgi:CheY-like chemotaxis protein
MPEMGGIEATEIIRANKQMQPQPVIIAVTANAFVEDRDKCLKAGMDYVLTKPINRRILEDTLELVASRIADQSSLEQEQPPK